MIGFDWPGLLRMAVQAGLRPHEFWALTPWELTLVLGLDDAPQPLNRARLLELERLYSKE